MKAPVLFVVASMVLGVSALAWAVAPGSAQGPGPSSGTLLASIDGFCLGGGVGPDGAVYVANTGAGTVIRVDPSTGATTTVATGLPTDPEFGGPTSLVFVGSTLYVLTTGPDSGIYRVAANGTVTLVADIEAFNVANPPAVDPGDLIPAGNAFGIEVLSNGDFIVVDANHNRLLRVTQTGLVSIITSFQNVVPTRAQPANGSVYLSQLGPEPNTAETGKVTLVNLNSGAVTTLASGVPMMIDVDQGPGGRIFALSFGQPSSQQDGPPAVPGTGQLLLVFGGAFRSLVTGLTLPVAVDFAGDTAFITTLDCHVWRVNNVSALVSAALTPSPTATATATATATQPAATAVATATKTAAPAPPSTGTGTASGGSGGAWILAALSALLMGAAGLAAVGRRAGARR